MKINQKRRSKLRNFRRNLSSLIPQYWSSSQIFRGYYKDILEAEYWSKEQIHDFQFKNVFSIVAHAYNTVPFYHSYWNSEGFHPSDIKDLADVCKIPFITKEMVQSNSEEFISSEYKKSSLVAIYSGGSTGVPATYYSEKCADSIERAFMYAQWHRIGYNVFKRNKIARLRGITPQFGNIEVLGNELILSSFFRNVDDLWEYVKALEKFNPDFIHAYPSIIFILANFLLKNSIDIKLPNLKSVLCGSENLYSYQRKTIETAFRTRVFSWYGHTERGCLAGECESSSLFHINPLYGYSEIINTAGENVLGQNGKGELVVTSFGRLAMPLIRFKTEDIIIATSKACSCKRKHQIFEGVEGRTQEYLITSKGLLIPGNVLLPYEIIGIFDNVLQYQFFQEQVGECIFRIVTKQEYTIDDENRIMNELKAELTEDMKILIEYVNEIPRTKSGKYMFLVTETKPWLSQIKSRQTS